MKRHPDVPTVRLDVSEVHYPHLLRAEAYASLRDSRELASVWKAVEVAKLRGLARTSVVLPCYSVPALVSTIERYAVEQLPGVELSNLHVHALALERHARRVAKDWAAGNLDQGDLFG